jgi:Flp pilus assembly protein TadB
MSQQLFHETPGRLTNNRRTTMNENSDTTTNKRNIWIRGLFMLLMALAYHVFGTVVFIVTVIQFVMMLLNDKPNARLVSFGRSLGRYLQQIVNFLTFATEEIPFPFNDWPAGE